MLRFFFPNPAPTNKPVGDVSTIVWVSGHSNLDLTSNKKTDQATDLMVSEVKKVLPTINSSTAKQVYKSYQSFKDSFDDLSSMGFPLYNCFIHLSVPTQCIQIVNTVFDKELVYLNQAFSLHSSQFQSIVILDEKLDIQNPLACIVGKIYQPLATLLDKPEVTSESVIEEITKLYQSNANCKKDNPICNALNAKKSCKDLATVFEAVFLQKTQSPEENFIKEAVLNLLAKVIYPQLVSSQELQNAFSANTPLFSTVDGPKMAEIIRECMQPPAAISSEITRRKSSS